MAQTAAVQLTYQDLLAMPEDGKRHELIDGVYYVSSAPRPLHQVVLTRLTVALGRYLDDHPPGVLLTGPADIVFSEIDVVAPDLLYISRERLGIVTEINISGGVPDLVVEILSPSTRRRDLVLKRRLYESRGVGEYWIVDPRAATVEVLRLEGGAYRTAAALGADDELTTPLLPGLAVPLGGVFADPFRGGAG